MTPRTSLRWRLRDATSGAHARLDARVADAFADIDGYAAFLRGMGGFVAAAAACTDDERLRTARDALASDLADLGVEPLHAAVLGPADAQAALGWRYVAAGASLGARVLLPKAQALGFDAGHGARYLALKAAGDEWQALLPALDVEPSPQVAGAVIAGAQAAFACAERSMAAAFEAACA